MLGLPALPTARPAAEDAGHNDEHPGARARGEGGQPGGEPRVGAAQRVLDAGQGPLFAGSQAHDRLTPSPRDTARWPVPLAAARTRASRATRNTGSLPRDTTHKPD